MYMWGVYIHVYMGVYLHVYRGVYIHVYMGRLYICIHVYLGITCISLIFVATVVGQGSLVAVKIIAML